jgi:hypothetical protein
MLLYGHLTITIETARRIEMLEMLFLRATAVSVAYRKCNKDIGEKLE